jgi:hypothetical protein
VSPIRGLDAHFHGNRKRPSQTDLYRVPMFSGRSKPRDSRPGSPDALFCTAVETGPGRPLSHFHGKRYNSRTAPFPSPSQKKSVGSDWNPGCPRFCSLPAGSDDAVCGNLQESRSLNSRGRTRHSPGRLCVVAVGEGTEAEAQKQSRARWRSASRIAKVSARDGVVVPRLERQIAC